MPTQHEFRFANGTKPELGRERVRQACHRCRLKKLKCDGIVPCGRCMKDDMICQHRERKGTTTEQTHAEYVSRLEEQQRILATALKLTWTRLHPEDADSMPSAHEIIGRLRMLPPDTGQATPRDSSNETTCDEKEAILPKGRLHSNASSQPSSHPSPLASPDLISPHSHRSSIASSAAVVYPADLKLPNEVVRQGGFDDVTVDFLEEDADIPLDWQDLDFSVSPRRMPNTDQRSIPRDDAFQLGRAIVTSPEPFGTVEPWQLTLENP